MQRESHLIKLGNQGFSIIQVLVGLGLMGILAMGFASIMANSAKHEANLGVLLEGRELSGEFSELAKSANCGVLALNSPLSFSSSLWTDAASINLTEGVSGRFLELKEGDKYGKFMIKGVSLSPYYDRKNRTEKYIAIDGANAADFAGASIVKASLKLNIATQNNEKSPIRTPVYLYLNPTKTQIIGCQASLEDSDLIGVCMTMGGSWLETESKCQLPCPPGLEDRDGVCTVNNGGTDTYCNVNERCGVADKYIISI